MCIRDRHKEALENSYHSLLKVKESVEAMMPEDFYSIDLMDAYEQLGLIIGESVDCLLYTSKKIQYFRPFFF